MEAAPIARRGTEPRHVDYRFFAFFAALSGPPFHFLGTWPVLALTAVIHVAAIVRLFQTEVGLFAQSLFVLAWIALNCVWLLILRRPALAAALSLAMFELLIAVSQFKFKITWMTATFLDVMVIDPDSLSFLLSVMPGLRSCSGEQAQLSALFCVAALWLFDGFRVRR